MIASISLSISLSIPLLADATSRTFYEVARLRSMNDWWNWLLLVVLGILLLVYVVRMYRRDGEELPRATRWLLILLRIVAFVGLLLFFLKIEKRTEQKLVKNSRAIFLVDTSQSMGIADADANGKPGASRLEQVAGILDGGLMERLREHHDVVVYRFDQDDNPLELATLPRTQVVDTNGELASAAEKWKAAKREATWLLVIAGNALAISVIAALAHVVLGALVRNSEGDSWALLVCVACLLVAGVVFSVNHLRNPQLGWRQVFRDAPVVEATGDRSNEGNVDQPAETDSAWIEQLVPTGIETRLGDSLRFVVEKERGGPVAGVVVFTDGNSNAGLDYRDAISAAQDAEIAVHPVGMGSVRQLTNVRVVDVEAPSRVYPGDAFHIRGFIQANGMRGQSVKVELSSQSVEEARKENGSRDFEEEDVLKIDADGEVLSVDFEVTPAELGERLYSITVRPTGTDLDDSDNVQTARVRIVDRKNKVLLLAGGPTREYRFVRNMLYRDKDTTTAVVLQSSGPGAAQEADEVLDEFPSTAQELFEYDCLLAFDPDWQEMDDAQIELIDRWVAEKAGGLILVAGPVYTPEWSTLRSDRRGTRTLKGLYPVTFFSRTVMRLARGNIPDETSTVRLTDDGRNARFLWLDDTSTRSDQVWSRFDGVYASFPVNGWKPGAVVLAELDDGKASSDVPKPFLVEQFYGAGRVLFLGSGELWRLRELDPTYFETIYTKMIRHVSQGRLLRDSSRGVLLVGKERCVLGETVTVRASLSDAQFRPLEREEVSATVIDPEGGRQLLRLVAVQDAARTGSYGGQFTAIREGDYRVELVVPETDDLEMLSRDVRVRVPELEIQHPQRNDAAMNEIAKATGGTYFQGNEQVWAGAGPLVSVMEPRDQETYLPGTPDRRFQQRLMGWLMVLICGVLSLEWLVRRLNKLA